jgi:hypothetical protein
MKNKIKTVLGWIGTGLGFLAAIPVIACMLVSFIFGVLWTFCRYGYFKGAETATDILIELKNK